MHRRYVCLMALLLLPLASAQAPEARSFETRILEEGADYGQSGLLDENGIDVLALDLYVGNDPGTLDPALYVRVAFHAAEPDGDWHFIEVDLNTPAFDLPHGFVTNDFVQYEGFNVTRSEQVGDVTIVEGIVPFSWLQLQTGDVLEDIMVQTLAGSDLRDIMPGTWYYRGQKVPAGPTEETPALGTYTVPARLQAFLLSSNETVIDPGVNGTTFDFEITNLLDLAHDVDVRVTGPAGINISVSSLQVPLAAGETAPIRLDVQGFATGDIQVFAESGIGDARLLSLPLAGGATRGHGGDVRTELMGQGESTKYIFTTPATFEYHCHPHPWMQGVIEIVEDDPTDEPAVHIIKIVEHDESDPDSYAFSPQDLMVQVNDTVVWINEGAQLHNIHGTTGIGGHGHDHDHDHDHGDPDEERGIPGLPLIWLLVALFGFVRRQA